METKLKTGSIIRKYKPEEMKAMNYILGKKEGNCIFTKFELEAMSVIDLLDRKVVDICKIIWQNKDDNEKLKKFQKILNMEVNA